MMKNREEIMNAIKVITEQVAFINRWRDQGETYYNPLQIQIMKAQLLTFEWILNNRPNGFNVHISEVNSDG